MGCVSLEFDVPEHFYAQLLANPSVPCLRVQGLRSTCSAAQEQQAAQIRFQLRCGTSMLRQHVGTSPTMRERTAFAQEPDSIETPCFIAMHMSTIG